MLAAALVRSRMALSEQTMATASTITVVERCRLDDEL
jgi:hypothetical protein